MARLEKNRSRKAMIESQRASEARGTNCRQRPFFTAAIRNEQGQAVIWSALAILLLLGASAFAVDIGHAYLVRKQLQASADAAALAASWHISDGTYAAVAQTYSSTGTLNNYSGYTVDTPVVTAKCSTTVASFGPTCDAGATPPTYNEVVVQETAHVPTFFAGVMGFHTLTVSATSAASKGARPTPFNVAIVLDTTASMNATDSNCKVNGVSQTQLQCAENAIATILSQLDPTMDKVSLFTFPGMEVGSAANDTDCSGTQATGEPYTFPAAGATSVTTPTLTTVTTKNGKQTTTTVQTTYQITTSSTTNADASGFLTDYIGSYKASSLDSSSALTKALGQSTASGCVGKGLVPNSTQNTYFAATVYQAQAALVAEQSLNSKSRNAMIILSDGNATAVDNSSFQDMACAATGGHCPTQTASPGVNNSSDGKYPNLQGECGQAVDAAQSFNDPNSLTGTEVFTIAYGSPASSTGGGSSGNGGNCGTDVGTGQHSNITPCQTMQQMSSGWDATPQDQSYFYSDWNDAAQGGTGCQASGSNNAITDLNAIASDIVSRFTQSRLVPPDAP